MSYISSANQKTLAARYRLTAIIVGALGFSSLLYLTIGWFFAPSMPSGEYPWLSPNIIVAVVLIAVLFVLFFRRFILSPTRLQSAAQKNGGAVLSSLYIASLVGAVIGDLVGIIGVIASLMTGVREFSLRLGIAAILLIAYSFPRRTEWERVVAFAETEKNKDFPVKSDNLPADAVRLGLTDTE